MPLNDKSNLEEIYREIRKATGDNVTMTSTDMNGQTVTTECGRFVRVSPCGSPPAAIDAFPIFDNDLAGPDRRDSIVVVFDRPVEKTSAEGVANYFLDSDGEIDGARRLDAPEDNRVVLQIRNEQPDGFPEAITVSRKPTPIFGIVR